MSAMLDSLLSREQLAEIAKHEPLRRFLVLIGPKEAPRIRLDVMAPDWSAAFERHAEMAEVGERLEIVAIPE